MDYSKTSVRAIAGAEPASAKRSKLVYRTTYDHPEPVHARIFKSGSGYIEMGFSASTGAHIASENLAADNRAFSSSGTHQKKKRKVPLSQNNRSGSRAKTTVRQLVHSMNAKVMLTLTYKENQTDYQTAKKDLQLFIRRAKNKFGSFTFVAVPERQRRGAWHWHIALNRRYPANAVREIWNHGSVNLVQKPPRFAASYLGKYVTKTFNSSWYPNEPRYLRSRDIKHNVKTKTFPTIEDAKDYFLKQTYGVLEYEWIDGSNGFLCN